MPIEVYQTEFYNNDEEIICTGEPKTATETEIPGLSSPSTSSVAVQANMYGKQLFFAAL